MAIVEARETKLRLLHIDVDTAVTIETSSLIDVQCVIIETDNFRDGRIFSVARLLRQRHGYANELIARGDILPDQEAMLRRCGFDRVEPLLRAQTIVPLDMHYQRLGTDNDSVRSVREMRRHPSGD